MDGEEEGTGIDLTLGESPQLCSFSFICPCNGRVNMAGWGRGQEGDLGG